MLNKFINGYNIFLSNQCIVWQLSSIQTKHKTVSAPDTSFMKYPLSYIHWYINECNTNFH